MKRLISARENDSLIEFARLTLRLMDSGLSMEENPGAQDNSSEIPGRIDN